MLAMCKLLKIVKAGETYLEHKSNVFAYIIHVSTGKIVLAFLDQQPEYNPVMMDHGFSWVL